MTARWRAGLVVAVGAALLLGGPATAPAQAHVRTQETTNVVSTITEDPALDGVTWTVHTGGLLVEVSNTGSGTLVIEGYDGEPYLRIGPDGTHRNRRSAATYLNRERDGAVTLPPVVDPAAPPEWVRISTRPQARWHDHRTHWMAPQPPDVVATGPVARAAMRLDLVGPIGSAGDAQGVLHDWEIPLRYEGQPATLHGVLAWRDAPSAWPWLALAGLLVAPGALGLRRGGDPSAQVRPAALLVGAVATVNGIHLVDDLLAWPGDLLDDLFGILHTSLFLGIGLAGAAWARWSDSGPRLALGVAGGAVLYHQGLVHLPMLFASDFPTVWPDGLVRLTVALGLAQAIVVATVLLASREQRSQVPPAGRDDFGPTARATSPVGGAQPHRARPGPSGSAPGALPSSAP